MGKCYIGTGVQEINQGLGWRARSHGFYRWSAIYSIVFPGLSSSIIVVSNKRESSNHPKKNSKKSIARKATDLDNSDQQVHDLHIWNLETLTKPLMYLFDCLFSVILVVMNGSVRGSRKLQSKFKTFSKVFWTHNMYLLWNQLFNHLMVDKS